MLQQNGVLSGAIWLKIWENTSFVLIQVSSKYEKYNCNRFRDILILIQQNMSKYGQNGPKIGYFDPQALIAVEARLNLVRMTPKFVEISLRVIFR